MSRALGRLQLGIIGELSKRGARGLTIVELRGEIYGWRPCRTGIYRDGYDGRWRPVTSEDRTLRRAVAGLVRRGVVREIEYERPQPHQTRRRYAPT
jgi:hypothetical protein